LGLRRTVLLLQGNLEVLVGVTGLSQVSMSKGIRKRDGKKLREIGGLALRTKRDIDLTQIGGNRKGENPWVGGSKKGKNSETFKQEKSSSQFFPNRGED